MMLEVPPDPVALPPNLRALIADDRVTNRTVLRAAFERFGWEVTDVNVAEEVLPLIESLCPSGESTSLTRPCLTMALSQVLSRVLQKGERYDILVLD